MSDRILPAPITLTSDLTRLAQLRAKLAEYEGRVEFTPPEQRVQQDVYKVEVLKHLLETGAADFDALCEVYRQKVSPLLFRLSIFVNVCGVIAGYNSGDTSNLLGGTGLK